jgi:hypothetical protein
MKETIDAIGTNLIIITIIICTTLVLINIL